MSCPDPTSFSAVTSCPLLSLCELCKTKQAQVQCESVNGLCCRPPPGSVQERRPGVSGSGDMPWASSRRQLAPHASKQPLTIGGQGAPSSWHSLKQPVCGQGTVRQSLKVSCFPKGWTGLLGEQHLCCSCPWSCLPPSSQGSTGLRKLLLHLLT